MAKIYGSAGDETLIAPNAMPVNDELHGLLGTDTLTGGNGDDAYYLNNAKTKIVENAKGGGTDTILASVMAATSGFVTIAAGIETLQLLGGASFGAKGGSGNDILIGNSVDNPINGGGGNDVLSGGDGNDLLFGEAGDDVLDGGLGADVLDGGAGNDVYSMIDAMDTTSELANGGIDRIEVDYTFDLSTAQGNNIENLTLLGNAAIDGFGNALNNTIIGNNKSNTLSGGVGNDILDGGAGADALSGGAGNDNFFVDNGGDSVTEFIGEGTDTVIASVDYTLAMGQEIEALKAAATVAAGLALTGNNFGNTITGSIFADALDGGVGGIDTLIGGKGGDIYTLNALTDKVIENAKEGTDVVLTDVTGYILAKNVENLFLNGTVADGTGNELDNVITGNAANNILDGAGGNDTLIGGAGADTLKGGKGNDTASYAGAAAGVVADLTNAANNTNDALGDIYSEIENLTGSSKADTLTGNALNNVLDGGAGTDILSGGKGDDTYFVDKAGDSVKENAFEGKDTVKASVSYTLATGEEIETLILLEMIPNLNIDGTGNEGINTIIGNSGNNTLDGGFGNDILIGGKGNDTYVIDLPGDKITEKKLEGTDTVFSTITYTLGTELENLTLDDKGGLIHGTGNTLDNVINGNIYDNKLDGAGGNDKLDGKAGDDWLIGNAGDDTLTGGAGSDKMDGGAGNDIYIVDAFDTIIDSAGIDTVSSSIDYDLTPWTTIENLTLTGGALIGTGNNLDNVINGNNSKNTLSGGIGNDQLFGGGGGNVADILDGGAGDDLLDGGTGIDTMTGGIGNDTYVVNSTADVIVENANEGIDTVKSNGDYDLSNGAIPGLANVENLTLISNATDDGFGNALDNILTGNNNDNVLDGAAGNDTLIGNDGDDTLIGGAGNDILNGGLGDDDYLIAVGDDNDKIFELKGGGLDTVYSEISILALAAEVEDIVLEMGFATALNATGNALDNTIIGNDLGNMLDGAGGNDTLIGGAGADTLKGGAGNDTASYEGAAMGVVADLTNAANNTNDAAGDTYNEIENLMGSSNDDTLTGNDKNNILDGGTGADTLIGGNGNDTYVVDDTNDVVIETGTDKADLIESSITFDLNATPAVENLTLTGNAQIDGTGNGLNNILIGNDKANKLLGGIGNDTLIGNKGDDWLDGGSGNDIMTGGIGDDDYYVDSKSDKLTENLNEGSDDVFSVITWVLGKNFENLFLGGMNAIDGTGNELDNQIDGNNAVNKLDGAAGNDLLQGFDGNDNILGGMGNDTAFGGNDDDKLDGGAGNDHLFGDDGIDTLIGGDGDDTLDGGNQADILDGGNGNDFLAGGTGADTLKGGTGNDTYFVDASDIVIEAAKAGIDTLQSDSFSLDLNLAAYVNIENAMLLGFGGLNLNATGNALDNVLIGDSDMNTLAGAAGNDTLLGGLGTDNLSGGAGNDYLDGGDGDDILTGGGGNDIFAVFIGVNGPGNVSSGGLGSVGKDTITDFATGDLIDLRDLIDVLGIDTSSQSPLPGGTGYLRITNSIDGDGDTVADDSIIEFDSNGGADSFVTIFVVQNNVTISQADLIF